MVLIILGGKDVLVPWAQEGPLWDEDLYDSFRGRSEFSGAAHGRSPAVPQMPSVICCDSVFGTLSLVIGGPGLEQKQFCGFSATVLKCEETVFIIAGY